MVFHLGSKGQTSVEFLFLFLIVLVIIHGVVYPAFTETQNSVLGLHRVGQARLAVKQIANAVSEVASATGESQRTIWIFLDDNITIHCDEANKRIYFRVPFDSSTRITEVKEGSTIVGAGCNQAAYPQGCESGEILHFPASSSLTFRCSNFHYCENAPNCSCNGVGGECIDGSLHKKLKILITKHYLTTFTSMVTVQPQSPWSPGGP